MLACHSKEDKKDDPATPAEEIKTPVTVAAVDITNLYDSIELNATSAFLQNNYVKSTTNGYVKSVNAKPGEFVKDGQILFTIVTK